MTNSPLLKVFLILLLAILSFSINDIYDLITQLGRNIPQTTFSTDYFTAVMWSLFFMISLLFLPIKKTETKALVILWAIRCSVTLVFMLVYESIYHLDAYHYYSVAKGTYFDTSSISFGRGTELTMWLSWLMNHHLPIEGSYHSLKVIYSFFGFIGCYIFYRAFCLYIQKDNIKLLYILGLFPSILFWSSILGKDPVVFLGISIYTLGVLGSLKTHHYKYIFLIITGVALASAFRIWTALILVTPLTFLFIFSGQKSNTKRFLYSLVTLSGFAFALSQFMTEFAIENTENLVSKSSTIATSWARGGSGQSVQEFTSLLDMVRFAPKGMFAALFRPLPFEVGSLFGIVAGFENLLTIILLVIGIRSIKKEDLKDPGVIWASSLVLIWSFVYGFASYQNLGSASRFKLQILPILITLLFYFIYMGRKNSPKNET